MCVINLTWLFTRLSNADQALENLHFFDSSYHTEEPWVCSLERSVSQLVPVSGRVEDAQRDVEVVMVCVLQSDDTGIVNSDVGYSDTVMTLG